MATREGSYGYRARIGYTSPPLTTEIFPYEFYKLVPDGVTLVLTTLAVTDRRKSEIDQSYEVSMKAAREMVAAGVDIVALGGVPINLSRGYDNATAMIGALEAELGVKVTSSASAQVKALKTLGARKLVVAHAFEASENDRFREYGVKFGCEVLDVLAWGCAFNQIGRMPRLAALEMGRNLLRRHPQADTIMFPSPHWPVIESIEALEQEFGVTVMTALQAIVWDALRLVGIDDRIAGYGRLLRDF